MGKILYTAYFLLLCTICTTTIQAQTFLANDSNGNLIGIDINGCATNVLIGIGSYTDIANHPNGFLYAVKSNGQLYQINSTTGNSNLISSFSGSGYYALTADADGTIFAASGSGALASYSPVSNQSITYSNMGFGASGDLTFYQGDMYMASTDNTMVRIDPNNPSNNTVIINFSSSNATIFGIVSAVDGCTTQTYALSNDNPSRVYQIDWDNQSFNFVCTVPHSIYGGSSEFEFNASAEFIEVNNIDIQADCGDPNADVSITATSVNGSLTYSLNNQPPQSSGNYPNLSYGEYTVLLTDGSGCTTTESFTVSPANNITVDNIILDNLSCGETTGSVTVEASSPEGGIMYDFDGNGFSSNNVLSNVLPGDYGITITDNSGCTTIASASIEEVPSIEILNINANPTSCGENNGSINIDINDNGNTAFYSLDGNDYSTVNSFSNLSGGTYTVFIRDDNDCIVQETVSIPLSEALILENINTSLTDCGEDNGIVNISAFGGNGIILDYSLNGQENNTGIFDNLASGEFTAYVSNNGDCEIGPFSVSIGDPCGIYIPNSFSPNTDGFNDIFQLYSPSEVQILEMLIFDRWGGLLYKDSNYSSTEYSRGWKGTSGGKEVPSGVYIYLYRISKNGTEELLKGDITLIR